MPRTYEVGEVEIDDSAATRAVAGEPVPVPGEEHHPRREPARGDFVPYGEDYFAALEHNPNVLRAGPQV